MLSLSNIPRTITPGDNISFSLHVRHPSSTQLLRTIQIEVVGMEHTMADNWSASTPLSRTFLCFSTELLVEKLITTEETIIPLSIQIPSMAYDYSKLVYCGLPPSVGSSQQIGIPTKGICVRYLLQVRVPVSSGLAQREVYIIPNDTGFNIDRFVDITGNSLNRQYSTTTRLYDGRFSKTIKGTVSLSGGIVLGKNGEAIFNLSFLYALPLPFSVSCKVTQTHFSCPQGMGQILDKTKLIQMRKVNVWTKDISDFVWEEKTGTLSLPYALGDDLVPNFVSVTTAVSYLFEVTLKFRYGSVKLTVPLVLGGNLSPPPAYYS